MTSPAWTPVGVGGGNNYVRYAHTAITSSSFSTSSISSFSPLPVSRCQALSPATPTSLTLLLQLPLKLPQLLARSSIWQLLDSQLLVSLFSRCIITPPLDSPPPATLSLGSL